MLYLYCHNPLSRSASVLSEALKIQRIRHTRSRFKGAPKKTVINWGAHNMTREISRCRVINQPVYVRQASNKLTFFEKLDGKKITPAYTTDIVVAEKWLKKGSKVVSRMLLNSSGGKGIIVNSKPGSLTEAPLYVQYIKKMDEYRVHIMGGEIFDIQRKARRIDYPNPNWEVRNYHNGFIYARSDFNCPFVVKKVAKECFASFELDFGAIDIICNKTLDKAWALEINTAPGLEGQTVDLYRDAFREYLL